MTTRTLQEASLLIVTALAAGSRHGSGIIADVRQISAGRVQLRPGTLYTAVARLRANGLVKVDREEIVGNRLRRYYRLTQASASLPSSPPRRVGNRGQNKRSQAINTSFTRSHFRAPRWGQLRCHSQGLGEAINCHMSYPR